MESKPYDIVVVGGGITGAGIARDAALRGLRVALFDKGDFACGTSSKSSKLIHGGLRYLEQGDIALVFESVSERRVQMQLAPHLVRPMPFLVPVYNDSRVGLELMNIGLWIYDMLALFRSPKLHKTLRGPDRVLDMQPGLRSEGLKGAIKYYDCATDDSRLVLENVIAAEAAGARCDSYTEVVKILREDRGQVSAVRVRDIITGEEETVKTRCVIMATGPWSDKASPALEAGIKTPLLSPTKGVHLVFPREVMPLNQTMTVISPIDGRVMFAIPWRGRTVIGTTDTYFHGDPDEVHADAADAAYLCQSANQLFPEADFREEDVISTWAGLRPLIHEDADNASAVSREHQVYVNDDGVLLIAGGKLTTYRIMAGDTVDAAVQWIRDAKNDPFFNRKLVDPKTKQRSLPGGEGINGDDPKAIDDFALSLASETDIPLEQCLHWALTYGARAADLAKLVVNDPFLGERLQADLPHTWAEIEFALESEHVRCLDDVLSRRVPLLLLGRDQGLDVLERVADRVASKFGWDDARRQAEIKRYQKSVADSRLFLQQ